MGKTYWTRGMDPTKTGDPTDNATDPEGNPEAVEMSKSKEADEANQEEVKKIPDDGEGAVEADPSSKAQDDNEGELK